MGLYMKIGILSFQQAINYGAVLQLYALEIALKKLGHNVEIINYQSEKFTKEYKINHLEHKIIGIFIQPVKLNKYKKFFDFTNKFLSLSKKVYTKDELMRLCEEYDYVIVGSDQVWNYELTNNDSTYLLDFVTPEKRLSYAASFGLSKLDDKVKEIYKKYLNEFKYITVREKQGNIILKDLCNICSPIVLDPTMLIDRNEWNSMQNNCEYQKNGRKFILIYCIAKSEKILRIAKILKEKTGFDIIDLNPRGIKRYLKNSAASAGPEDFVYLFQNAQYVLTNSFHGTAFSINLHKKFLVDIDNKGNTNSRIVNILELFEMNDRILDDTAIEKMDREIEYNRVEEILKRERMKSITIINKMLE